MMNPKVESAIYKAFEELFDRSYRQPSNAAFKARVWAATKKAGFDKSRGERLLLRALEIMAEGQI